MDATARRPWIDWIHTASAQGELVRDFTKWEHQPASVAAIPEAILRAWQLAHVEPRGPVYVCLDAGLQEQRLGAPLVLPDVAAFAQPTGPAPDPAAVAQAAALLVAADRPLLLLGHTGGGADTWAATVALAEALGAAVVTDRASQAAFPTDHPLHQGMTRTQTQQGAADAIREADVILAIQRTDVAGALAVRDGRQAHVINVTLEPYAVRSWSADYQALVAAELTISASAGPAVIAIGAAVVAAIREDGPAQRRIAERSRELGDRSRTLRDALHAANAAHADDQPIRTARAIAELRATLGPRAADAIVAQAPHALWPTASWDFQTPEELPRARRRRRGGIGARHRRRCGPRRAGQRPAGGRGHRRWRAPLGADRPLDRGPSWDPRPVRDREQPELLQRRAASGSRRPDARAASGESLDRPADGSASDRLRGPGPRSRRRRDRAR